MKWRDKMRVNKIERDLLKFMKRLRNYSSGIIEGYDSHSTGDLIEGWHNITLKRDHMRIKLFYTLSYKMTQFMEIHARTPGCNYITITKEMDGPWWDYLEQNLPRWINELDTKCYQAQVAARDKWNADMNSAAEAIRGDLDGHC